MAFSSNDKTDLLADILPVTARLFDNSDAAVSLFDDQDRLLYGNDPYYDLICHTPGTHPTWPDIVRDNYVKGHGLIVETDDIKLWIRTALSKRRTQHYRQFEVDAWDGRWLLMTETLVSGGGLLNIGVDITQAKNITTALKQEYQNALVKAETDLLTGMGNRRALERLRKILVSKGRHFQVTALMIDIDQFKPYNDTLGHLQGDLCLQQVAGIIRSGLREGEAYPIRLGGDEFLVLMLDASLSLAQQVAQRIRNRLSASAIPHPATDSGLVTLSMGLASRDIGASESLSSLLKDADDALYKAKRDGRNRILSVPDA
ncbi:GGDEF domain-containing protein [Halomonas sp. SH5A2]|uniref:sensor domain-containing diguanylate cyclase n=1 Tax=Halomonas sp. SH5A2 TaxID=2749040 RepID=UPI00164102CC|nr:sensor domain-containing diguanylate cyclase [Halomonas sp. SH5A2]QNI01670.1 GGDEF domain-containing protein [Halomonas sp. SH5A2]